MKLSLMTAAAFAVLSAVPAHAAATIIINNVNAAGVGFNDPTPVAPVGGNTGTTLGQQRLNVFAYAATIWGSKLDSNVTIRVNASFEALNCSATGAVLGSAGASAVYRDFAGAPVAGHWYPKALANKLFGSELDAAMVDINARFNSNLGQTGCLTGIPFYLGLDANEGSAVDLAAVVLHELGHGLGFQTFTSGSTGAYLVGAPSIWDSFLFDRTTGLTWNNMTDTQRVASAISLTELVWNGPNVTGATSSVLVPPAFRINAPASIAGTNAQVGTASFGPPLNTTGVTGEVMPVVAQPSSVGIACEALNAANVAAVSGKLALIDRGGCTFLLKVKNAQNAGAIGVVIVNNTSGVSSMVGVDATITIPSLMISQAAGNSLKTALQTRSRTRSGVFASLLLDPGASPAVDNLGRIRMYAPNPFQGGSSVSHFDVSAFPNQLMEPSINADLPHLVDTPRDLTFKLLKDIGW